MFYIYIHTTLWVITDNLVSLYLFPNLAEKQKQEKTPLSTLYCAVSPQLSLRPLGVSLLKLAFFDLII